MARWKIKELCFSVPGAKEKTAKHSPVEATAVTNERFLSKYCESIVTAGRKARQYPKPMKKCQKTPLVQERYWIKTIKHFILPLKLPFVVSFLRTNT